MLIAECNLDDRGRLTLPKSFLKANNITTHTKVYIKTMYNTGDAIKLVFINEKEKSNEKNV
tara:strand:- start:2207 stop:2389 length:183 start_codon:yes stop_codon:yes gene_type:complete